jgi:hypothetical protein
MKAPAFISSALHQIHLQNLRVQGESWVPVSFTDRLPPYGNPLPPEAKPAAVNHCRSST